MGIEAGRLYVVHVIVPCTKSTNGVPPLEDSDGIGRDGGYAEYIVVDQRQLIPVVSPLSPEFLYTVAQRTYSCSLRDWPRKWRPSQAIR